MYDKMRLTDSKQLYDIMHSWISVSVQKKIIKSYFIYIGSPYINSNNILILFQTNINAEIIKCPQFVRALTIAIVIVCLSKLIYNSDMHFINSMLIQIYNL